MLASTKNLLIVDLPFVAAVLREKFQIDDSGSQKYIAMITY